MKILLTGGSGTVGREVLRLLSGDLGYDITVFDKKSKSTVKFYKAYRDRVHAVLGDLSKKEEVESVCSNIDAVIHLAAIIPPLADEYPDLAYDVNVIGTKNLLDSLKKNSKDAFFIYASSVSVYGDRLSNPLINIGDPLLPSLGDEYAVTKIQAENLVKSCGLNWTVFRLSAIMGVDNHKVSGLMFHMPLSTPIEITTPEDTAKAFVSALDKKDILSGNIYNLGGGEACRIIYKDFLERAFDLFGLGALDFPEKAFADKNFHCGYYQDGDTLNDILKFRGGTMKTYFENLDESVKPIRKKLTHIFRRSIKKYILNQSEPFKAFSENDEKLLMRFFENGA